MKDSAIIDTNILVYAYDKSEKEKREKCSQLIKSVFNGERECYVTNQILSELFFVLTKKIEKPASFAQGKVIVNSLLASPYWRKVNYNDKTVKKAISLVERFAIPFWDAVIVATMFENDIYSICTENIKDFEKIPRLNVINPMKIN